MKDDNLKLLLKESYARESYLEEEIRDLRRERFKRFNEEEYWIYLEGENNYPESLVCPVVMSADQFRAFLSGKDCSEEYKAKIGADAIRDMLDSICPVTGPVIQNEMDRKSALAWAALIEKTA